MSSMAVYCFTTYRAIHSSAEFCLALVLKALLVRGQPEGWMCNSLFPEPWDSWEEGSYVPGRCLTIA